MESIEGIEGSEGVQVYALGATPHKKSGENVSFSKHFERRGREGGGSNSAQQLALIRLSTTLMCLPLSLLLQVSQRSPGSLGGDEGVHVHV